MDFWQKADLKKNRFLLIAFTVSILLHALAFVFAPELKSEINPSDYIKKITQISIFREENKSAPENRNVEIPKPRNIGKKRAPENRNVEISESRNTDEKTGAPENRNIEISESRNIDEKTGVPNRNIDNNNSAPDNTPKTAGELAVIPKALNPKTPDYPEVLEDEGVEGNVTLELLISKEGKVLKAKVIKSDHELFSESALKVVKNYKFSPGKLADGSAADSLIEFVIKFEISL